jgi:hypothetical protein
LRTRQYPAKTYAKFSVEKKGTNDKKKRWLEKKANTKHSSKDKREKNNKKETREM